MYVRGILTDGIFPVSMWSPDEIWLIPCQKALAGTECPEHRGEWEKPIVSCTLRQPNLVRFSQVQWAKEVNVTTGEKHMNAFSFFPPAGVCAYSCMCLSALKKDIDRNLIYLAPSSASAEFRIRRRYGSPLP